MVLHYQVVHNQTEVLLLNLIKQTSKIVILLKLHWNETYQ